MNITNNTILITGGGTGIGLSLAKYLLDKQNNVIICGRREKKLAEAKEKFPLLHTKVCDIQKPEERERLLFWSIYNFEHLNILINNAGIQRMIDFKKGIEELNKGDNEIAINFEALVTLSALFIPHLMKQKESAIVNVSSGLAFMPMSFAPVYCATKAAVHSFSISLREQLKDTTIKVFEIIPPIVDTELDKGTRTSREMTNRGIPPDDVASKTIKALEGNNFEIGIGHAADLVKSMKYT